MTEAFADSGWKDKKLWSPPEKEEKTIRGHTTVGSGAPTSVSNAPGNKILSGDAGPRSRLRAEGAASGIAASLSAPGEDKQEVKHAEPDHVVKAPKAPRQARKPLEALDPESSSEEESDEEINRNAAENAVLDLNVPRTALVINVAHVLKRLNGSCSLNQLTKAIKNFKEKTGVPLEAFLRANPTTFKLEGRIIFLIGPGGEKWVAPPAPDPPADKGKGKKGKGKGKGKGKVEERTDDYES